MGKKKIAVVTAIAGGFDKLHEPKFRDENADYIAFIDQDIKSNIWQIRRIEYTHFKQPRMTAKIHKILIHKYCDYEYTLWVDGALSMLGSIGELINNFLGQADIALFRHRFRNCAYEEHLASFRNTLHAKGEPRSVRENQIKRYRNEGLPVKLGLYECTFILRKNNEKVRKFNEMWWSEVSVYSSSDQVPFMYTMWKNSDIKIATIRPGHAHDSKWARYIEHGKE